MPATQPIDLAHEFVKTWNSHDMVAFGALFQDDAEFVNVFGRWWTGRPQIQREHEVVHSTIFKTSRLTSLEVRAKHLSPDVAHVHMRWDLSGIHTPDGPLPSRTGILLFIVVRDAEGWRIAAAQNTDTAPA